MNEKRGKTEIRSEECIRVLGNHDHSKRVINIVQLELFDSALGNNVRLVSDEKYRRGRAYRRLRRRLLGRRR
jgi:hypothetical protein